MALLELNNEKRTSFVVMPDAIETAFKPWWISLADYHVVDIRCPHKKHGLSGKVSNNGTLHVKEAVDNNSSPIEDVVIHETPHTIFS